MNSALNFARDVIAMQVRIEDLEMEVTRLKRYEHDYNELLDSALAHNRTMVGNLLEVCMTPGVVDAMREHHKLN
jgi:hypothetical protein